MIDMRDNREITNQFAWRHLYFVRAGVQSQQFSMGAAALSEARSQPSRFALLKETIGAPQPLLERDLGFPAELAMRQRRRNHRSLLLARPLRSIRRQAIRLGHRRQYPVQPIH